jgi:uncharacterized protein YbcC (UPF0753/DUF2309 family)
VNRGDAIELQEQLRLEKEQLRLEKEKVSAEIGKELIESNKRLKKWVEELQQEIKDKEAEIAEAEHDAEKIVESIYNALFQFGWSLEKIRAMIDKAERSSGFGIGGYIGLPM